MTCCNVTPSKILIGSLCVATVATAFINPVVAIISALATAILAIAIYSFNSEQSRDYFSNFYGSPRVVVNIPQAPPPPPLYVSVRQFAFAPPPAVQVLEHAPVGGYSVFPSQQSTPSGAPSTADIRNARTQLRSRPPVPSADPAAAQDRPPFGTPMQLRTGQHAQLGSRPVPLARNPTDNSMQARTGQHALPGSRQKLH